MAFGFFGLSLFFLFLWRVSSAPLDVTFAKDYIQFALHDEATGNYARLSGATLFWPDLSGPLFLEIENGELLNRDDESILSVKSAAISFSRAGLLSLKLMPKSILLKGPTLRIVRTVDNDIRLDFGQVKSSASSEEQAALTTRIFNYIARPGVEGETHSLISRLRGFSIEDARLFVDDQVAKQSWSFPDFNLQLLSTQTGLKGSIDMVMPDVGLEASGLHVDMNYIWDQKNVEIAADFKSIDLKAIAMKVPELGMLAAQDVVFDAHVETILNEQFMPSDVRVQIASKEGEISHPDVSDNPVPYEDLLLGATYNYAGKSLKINDARLSIGGIALMAQADVIHTDDAIAGPVTLKSARVEQAQIPPVWPKILKGDSSEKWVVQRMSGGVFKDLSLEFTLVGEKILQDNMQAQWDFDAQRLQASFSFEDMDVDYRAPLDPMEGLFGRGQFDLDTDILNIEVDKGMMAGLDISNATLLFDEVAAEGKGSAHLSVGLKGDIANVLRYIAKEPIEMGEKVGLDPSQVKGQADLRVNLDFPTQEDVLVEDFKIGLEGTLSDVYLPDVVDTLDLSGGPLKFEIKEGAVKLAGDAMLEKRAINLTWQTFLDSKGKPYDEKLTAKIMVDPNLRSLMGIDLSDFLEGSVFVDMAYASYRDGTAKADIAANLSPSVFFVEPFGYIKPSGIKGEASFKARFKNRKIQQITDLNGFGEGFQFSDAVLDFHLKDGEASLKRGSFPSFTIGQSQGKLTFLYADQGDLDINLDALVLDAEPFLKPDDVQEAYTLPPMHITMSADTLLTAPERAFQKAKLDIDINAEGVFTRWQFEALAGDGGVSAYYKPDNQGARNFKMLAEDAGGFLRAFNIYDNMRGGRLEINGEPARGVRDRNLKGDARIYDFHVVKAPVMTKLFSLLSLTGLGDAFANKGMKFDKMAVDFQWLFRPEGSMLVLKDGRTTGNSLGLLFEGNVDNAKREVDISGTIVPMSGINKIIDKIPLVGDILTGGSGGVFAATYKIQGPTDDPKVSANPLSVLTPGILRKILFE